MSRASQKRDWTVHLIDQQRSGISIAAYCRKHGLNCWTFYKWRSKHSSRIKPSLSQPSFASQKFTGTDFVHIGTIGATTTVQCKIRFVNGTEICIDGAGAEFLCRLTANLQNGGTQIC